MRANGIFMTDKLGIFEYQINFVKVKVDNYACYLLPFQVTTTAPIVNKLDI